MNHEYNNDRFAELVDAVRRGGISDGVNELAAILNDNCQAHLDKGKEPMVYNFQIQAAVSLILERHGIVEREEL